ncbi:putative short-chain type dehydrogenase/reductase [Mycobacterium ulcerans str. Harvey]|uniref:Short-chain type dehydrogenase/reductase n=1 Tax=Mycobacterium ulcerans str. Harvey TaxID=1299332 RepID=A0ABP3A1Z6_MYCUL|nr:putative short-chain type dehydrogenase/reductase [Mycobacterium ulcerans str. Harvey]
MVLADNNADTLASVAESLAAEGHDVRSRGVDVCAAESVHDLAQYAATLGAVTPIGAHRGVVSTQASAQAILAVDLVAVRWCCRSSAR